MHEFRRYNQKALGYNRLSIVCRVGWERLSPSSDVFLLQKEPVEVTRASVLDASWMAWPLRRDSVGLVREKELWVSCLNCCSMDGKYFHFTIEHYSSSKAMLMFSLSLHCTCLQVQHSLNYTVRSIVWSQKNSKSLNISHISQRVTLLVLYCKQQSKCIWCFITVTDLLP